jgi:hypothetical protein
MEEEESCVVEPLLWSVTGLDDEKDEPVLRQCRILARVFRELDGGALSAGDRTRAEQLGNEGGGSDGKAVAHFTSLAYGEVLFEPFAELLLRKVWPHWQRHNTDKEWHTFVDLGSGLGKAVWVACLIPGGFAKSVGIELLTPLHDGAMVASKRLQPEIRPYVLLPKRTASTC